ncbi:MAG: hypothetical protein AB1589_03245 [Cyanobacteriota bacterium]
MTQIPPDDQQWQEFLRKHHPTPPPAAADLEEQLMKAVAESPQLDLRLWALPPALVAGLLMILSSYRFLIPIPEPSNAVSIEAFFQDNWNEVMKETPSSLPNNNNVAPTDWRLEAKVAH